MNSAGDRIGVQDVQGLRDYPVLHGRGLDQGELADVAVGERDPDTAPTP